MGEKNEGPQSAAEQGVCAGKEVCGGGCKIWLYINT